MYHLYVALFFVALFAGMVGALELGRRLGVRQRLSQPDGGDPAVGAMDGMVFAVFGLLLAFTFSGAAGRFDHRRELAVNEANAIETAYLRLDLLPADAQPELRDLLRRYVESRLVSYQRLPDLAAFDAECNRSAALLGRIWKAAVPAAKRADPSPLGFLVGPLNDMETARATRVALMWFHVPLPIVGMLLALATAASLLAGRALSVAPRRSWFNMLAFAVVVAVSLYVIFDYEFPRFGFIREDAGDQQLVRVLDTMR